MALVVCAITNARDTPRSQIAGSFESNYRAHLANLFVTEREGKDDYEFSWLVSRLPCQVGTYRLLVTMAAIASAQDSSEEAQVLLLSARLPKGTRCGTPLTFQPGEKLTMTFAPRSRAEEGRSPLLYSGDGVKIESFTPCVSFNGLCTGQFVMTATLDSPHRHLAFKYRFRIFYVKRSGRFESHGGTSPIGALKCQAR
jgi:hypothetical protein